MKIGKNLKHQNIQVSKISFNAILFERKVFMQPIYKIIKVSSYFCY